MTGKQQSIEAKIEEMKRQRQLMEIRCKCIGDDAIYKWTFSNDNGNNPVMKKAYAYVENWEEMKKHNCGLLLWGGVGTGKSFFAGCIANALTERLVTAKMTNFAHILNELGAMYSEKRNEYLKKLNEYELLILDDLGAERGTDYALEQVYSVIDNRYKSAKPLIVTTNLTISQLQNPADLNHARIYDRVLEMCVPVRFDGKSIRRENAAEKLAVARKFLSV